MYASSFEKQEALKEIKETSSEEVSLALCEYLPVVFVGFL